MSWSNAYLGLTEADCHCWALVVRVYARELGVTVPDYGGHACGPEEHREIAAVIERDAGGGTWNELPTATARQAFDVALFRRGAIRQHVGILITPQRMLHMDRRAVIAPVDRDPWGKRLMGVYRHASRPAAGGAQ